MLKVVRKRRKNSLRETKKNLAKNHACYVLITCSDPAFDGTMDVEMSFDGDEALAAYLVESARGVFDERLQRSGDSFVR